MLLQTTLLEEILEHAEILTGGELDRLQQHSDIFCSEALQVILQSRSSNGMSSAWNGKLLYYERKSIGRYC